MPQLSSSAIVPIVRAAGFPKYDKIKHSAVVNSEETGVTLRPEAFRAVAKAYPGYAQTIAGKKKRRQNDARRSKPHLVRCRLTPADFARFLRWMKEDGFKTQQDFLEECIRCYGTLNGKDFM